MQSINTTETRYNTFIQDHGFEVQTLGGWFILFDPEYQAQLIKSKNLKDLYDAVRGITQ